jgi:hypothetical protein
VRPGFEDGLAIPDLLFRESTPASRTSSRDPGATILPGPEAAGDDVAIGDDVAGWRMGPNVVADEDATNVRNDAPTSIRASGPAIQVRPQPAPGRMQSSPTTGYEDAGPTEPSFGRVNLVPLSFAVVVAGIAALLWVFTRPADPTIQQAPTPVVSAPPAAAVPAVATRAAPVVAAGTPAPVAAVTAAPDPSPPRAAPAPAPSKPAAPVTVAAPAPTPAVEPEKVAQCLKDASLVGTAAVGKEATFRVTACQPGAVTLHYRAANGAWLRKGMAARNGVFAAKVMLDASFRDGVEWYVSADGAAAGSQSRPFKAEVL